MKKPTRKFKIISENGYVIDSFETYVSFKIQLPTMDSFKKSRLGHYTLPEVYHLCDVFNAKIIEIE